MMNKCMKNEVGGSKIIKGVLEFVFNLNKVPVNEDAIRSSKC